MEEMLLYADLALTVLGFVLFAVVCLLIQSGRLTVEKEIGIALVTFGLLPFAFANNWRDPPPLPVSVRFLLVANAIFLVALALQLYAHARQSPGGPTHPKDREVEPEQTEYSWEEK